MKNNSVKMDRGLYELIRYIRDTYKFQVVDIQRMFGVRICVYETEERKTMREDAFVYFISKVKEVTTPREYMEFILGRVIPCNLSPDVQSKLVITIEEEELAKMIITVMGSPLFEEILFESLA